jgi:hypothetical protein
VCRKCRSAGLKLDEEGLPELVRASDSGSGR